VTDTESQGLAVQLEDVSQAIESVCRIERAHGGAKDGPRRGEKKCFKLTYMSQSAIAEIECVEYASLPDATVDLPATKDRVDAEPPGLR
jgi:hypothetical protein